MYVEMYYWNYSGDRGLYADQSCSRPWTKKDFWLTENMLLLDDE